VLQGQPLVVSPGDQPRWQYNYPAADLTGDGRVGCHGGSGLSGVGGTIRVGELDGKTIEEYRAWKHGNPRSVAFPGGESLDDAAARYAEGFARLLASRWETVLVVCHEIPLRYLLNAAGGSDELDGPVHELRNATPYLFDEGRLARGVEGLARLTRGEAGSHQA